MGARSARCCRGRSDVGRKAGEADKEDIAAFDDTMSGADADAAGTEMLADPCPPPPPPPPVPALAGGADGLTGGGTAGGVAGGTEPAPELMPIEPRVPFIWPRVALTCPKTVLAEPRA